MELAQENDTIQTSVKNTLTVLSNVFSYTEVNSFYLLFCKQIRIFQGPLASCWKAVLLLALSVLYILV